MTGLTRTELQHALPDHDPDEVLAVIDVLRPDGIDHLPPAERWREARMAAQTVDSWRRHNPDLVARLAASRRAKEVYGF